MRRALLLCALLFGAACDGPTPRTPDGHTSNPKPDQAGDVLAKLANEMDPGPQPSLWAQAPADVRARVEIDAPRERSPEARLAAARDRIGSWSLNVSTTDPGALAQQLYRAFEGVYLVEPLALAAESTPSRLEACALLWRFYIAFAGTAGMLNAFATAWGGPTGTALPNPMPVAELFNAQGVKMADHFAAEVLRAHAPEQTISDILWQQATRKVAAGDAPGGRAIYAEYVRRGRTSPSLEDQMRVAEAHIRLEDVRSATDAIARARSTATAADRSAQARILEVERDRERLVRLLALPADKSPETALARFDLLLGLDRVSEAASVLDALSAQRPKDARVRSRSIQLRVSRGEITDRLVEVLRGDDLTDRDGAYWSMRVGAAGIAVAKTVPNRDSAKEVAAAGVELGKYDRGRTAALAFVVERASMLIEKQAGAPEMIAVARSSFDEAVPLRARYPTTPDVDRIVLATSLFTTDPAKGLAAALVRPQTAPVDDPELYLQRAQTVVTLAAYAAKVADLVLVRQAVEDIPPSTSVEVEGTREALLGDVDVLHAVARGDRAAWARAVAHYETAKKTTKADRARLDNNLAYAAAVAGDAQRASKLYEESGREKTGRVWVPLLNQATAPGMSKEDQLAALRTMAGPPDAVLPGLVNAWRAWLEPDAKTAAAAATKAIADYDNPLAFHKVALHTMGLETEGSFALGLGLRSRLLGHVFSASAYATLWLVRPMPLTRAELEAKAHGRLTTTKSSKSR